MKKVNFEDYLQDVCFSKNTHVLDDDIPDYFNDWLGKLDNEELIEYGQMYGDSIKTAIKDKIGFVYESDQFDIEGITKENLLNLIK